MTMLSNINAVCPYYTMFPLDFPLRVLRRHAEGRAWVLDPFCGRGTTNFAARLLGLPSVGIDSSPVAATLAMAKLPRVSAQAVIRTAKRILESKAAPADTPEGEFWRWAYHADTLADVCRLRASLLRRCDTKARKVLRAIVMGALHGPVRKTVPTYLSNQCPRTFAPKPAYSVAFWKERRMKPPKVDALDVIKSRAVRYLSGQPRQGYGRVICGDSRIAATLPTRVRFSQIITSPPYYGMRTYIPDQWLRSWFVGGPSHVEYGQPRSELNHHSPDEFIEQLGKVWSNALRVCTSDANMVIRFGGIHDRKQEPMMLLKESLASAGWRIVTAHRAGSAHHGKRQAEQFQIKSQPMQEYDVYARPA